MYPYKSSHDAIEIGTLRQQRALHQDSEKKLEARERKKIKRTIRTDNNTEAGLELTVQQLDTRKCLTYSLEGQGRPWEEIIVAVIGIIAAMYNQREQKKITSDKLSKEEDRDENYKKTKRHRDRRGGMNTNEELTQGEFKSISPNGRSSQTNNVDEEEWDFLQGIPDSITVEEDEYGNVLFRRNDYGLMITRRELDKCLRMVTEMRTIEEINSAVEVQALYNFKDSESRGTAGQGLCAILALAGTMNPILNSPESIKSKDGRNAIAELIEEILIPSVKDYIQPSDFQVNPRSPEHSVHKDHTIHHLVTLTSLLRDTLDTYVDEDEWMYATGVGTIIQAMPLEVTYWQEIRDVNWISLDIWSRTASDKKQQTIQTLQEILKEDVGHVAYARSHFFNVKDIRVARYKNLLIEVVNAMTLTQEHKQREGRAHSKESDSISPEEIDEGSITAQKSGARWFMSISKKRARELSRYIPSQIKEELLRSKSTIQINKRTASVNWSLINGDNYCGYQALHAVAMHAEGKSYQEISSNIQTCGKPYKLIAFLQKQIHKVQGINMKNALGRINTTVQCLKGQKSINKTSWCPTELIEHVLPTLHSYTNYWNHSRPPTGDRKWITTYYNEKWLDAQPGLDIVFNGEDHYSILPNNGISARDLTQGIESLVNMILGSVTPWHEWEVVKGQRMTRMEIPPRVISMDSEEEEYVEVTSKRARKKSKADSHGHKVTESMANGEYSSDNSLELVTPRCKSQRVTKRHNYGPIYHPLDDAIPSPLVEEIPFPKTQRTDPTALKCLVIAPSRIGDGMGVYTLAVIPANTIIMDYVDEEKEVIMKRDVSDGSRDTTYMYANHKTNTYINASNNKNSYCGLVNEALEDRNYNTIICETRDNNGTRVYYKTTRVISAREEIGTRYSIDGSYWDPTKTYSTEFMNKVEACYNRTIPFQRESRNQCRDNPNRDNIQQELMQKYNEAAEKRLSTQQDNPHQNEEHDIHGFNMHIEREVNEQKYATPIINYKRYNKEIYTAAIEESKENDNCMEVSENESMESYNDKHHRLNITRYEVDTISNKVISEFKTTKLSSMKQPKESTDSQEQVRKHIFKGGTAKRKWSSVNKGKKDDILDDDRNQIKHRRGIRRTPRREQNAKRRQQNELAELSAAELEELDKRGLVEYILNQRCRHKKALDNKVIGENQVHESSANFKKKQTKTNRIKLNKVLKSSSRKDNTIKKDHNLRNRKLINYVEQLDNTCNMKEKKRQTPYKEPCKPKYTLNDITAVDPDAFMVAGSRLKNGIQGVYAREAIPLKGSRKLFEYTSENSYGTTQSEKVSRYLAFGSDNKYLVNVGNVVVDATHNVSSYCNHVQELLNHNTPFNCKYVKSGNKINIVQISPIAKYEELNIQYSIDGSFWNNRKGGYPEEILRKARKYYNISEPEKDIKKIENYDMPNYSSIPKKMEDRVADFDLMNKATLFRWTDNNKECNLRIATLNMNGALFDTKNGEPQFALQIMTQCGINILGLTDTRTPTDKADSTIKSMKYPQPRGTAVICFPTTRVNKSTSRLTTMGGQMIIIDKQWEPWISHKKSDDSKLCLIVSIGITYQQKSLTIIQVMVPPQSPGDFTMWSRINKYLVESGIRKTPRDYVLDTASKWHMNELAKGNKVIVMGDFNRTYTQMNQWQNDNNLYRAHEKITKAQEHPDRTMYTYLRNATTYSHIDHIYHSTLDPIRLTSVGATDHVHIHEKTDHFPIWIALKWPGHMKEVVTHTPSTSIRNQPDLDLEDSELISQFAKELDEYIEQVGEISQDMTPEEAGRIQAAIYAKSAEIARGSNKPNFQTTRQVGIHHRYKDGFSPSFRILQESLHAYINLGRALNRLTKNTHTAVIRLKEMRKIYPRWKKVYDKYFKNTQPEDHCDAPLLPLDLYNISLKHSKSIDIAEKIAKIKSRLHGRQRTILRAKLSERCKTMQYNISINKLKKVIQMIIPTERSAFDYAAIILSDGTPINDKLADIEANRVMQKWMETPSDQHYISQEFEEDKDKWKSLLNGTYQPPLSAIPNNTIKPVINAFRMKEISEQTKNDLSKAMHEEFTFQEFNRARKNMAKNKSPGPSGVTNNQMRSWSDSTTKAIFDLSSIMWKHHSVPQFWQDRLMTLLPKIAGTNELSKIRPISLFENIRKLWAGMVSRRIQTIWNRDKLLHENQHGFRWQRGTHTAVLHLLNQLELADSADPVYLTMWDIRRAFDSVPKWLQRLAWARLGLDTSDLEWFLKLDATGNIYIRTPEFEAKRKQRTPNEHMKEEIAMLEANNSNQFHPERGVGQGDTPSSLIFIAVFDILLTLLQESNTGQPHAYADDLAHIAKSQRDQQIHADLVSAFCVVTGLEVATTKVEAIALNHCNTNFTTTLVIRDWWWTPHLVIQSDKDFWTRYLGIYLDNKQCIKHYEQAVKQYRFSCHALIHRTAPSSAKKMVHTLCLRPKMRYVAALSPWTLQQYKKIDQIPYQLYCQIYGLRRGFPLALIYAPISMGGCGDTKLSDEANSMKWKIIHSCIHLGGLSKRTSNELLQRALTRRREGQKSRGYADSLIEWCMEMGLTLHQHTATSDTYPMIRLNQILKLQDPHSDINIYSDGAYDTEKTAPLIDKLIMTPTQLRHMHGVGKTGIYIEGTLINGTTNKLAMQLTFRKETKVNTTPFLQELIGIFVGTNIAQRNPNTIRAFTDCKSALAKVKDAITAGTKSASHLPYGSIISAIKSNNTEKYRIDWIESHPEKKKKHMVWNNQDNGIHRADLVASKSLYDIRKGLPDTTLIQGDITDILNSVIPTGTWMWLTNEGTMQLESLRALSLQSAHTSYLNRRDTLRNKGDMQAPARWSKYNMYLATHINGSRQKCSTRQRGHRCKQMYDWTTHAVNLAKGVTDKEERSKQAQCKLCDMKTQETQIHTSTACKNAEIQYIRGIYKKEITDILLAFNHTKLHINDKWIKEVINYISKHIWEDTETTSDIWNGRWTRHMWEDALVNVDEKVRAGVDITKCRKWLSILTSKLFEAQSAMSRHRFKLAKRLKDPMFEREKKMPKSLKQHILNQYEMKKNMHKRDKRKERDASRETNKEKEKYCNKRKRADSPIIDHTDKRHRSERTIKQRMKKKRTKTPHKEKYQNDNKKRKLPTSWTNQDDKRCTKKHKNNRHEQKRKLSRAKVGLKLKRAHTLSYNINTKGQLGHKGLPIRRGWYSYLRHTYQPKYQIHTKHKLYCRTEIQLRKRQK